MRHDVFPGQAQGYPEAPPGNATGPLLLEVLEHDFAAFRPAF